MALSGEQLHRVTQAGNTGEARTREEAPDLRGEKEKDGRNEVVDECRR